MGQTSAGSATQVGLQLPQRCTSEGSCRRGADKHKTPGGGLKDVMELFTTKMGEDATPFFAYWCSSLLKTAPSKVDEDLVG